MAKLVFDAAALKRVVEHSIANKQSEVLVDYDKDFNPITEAPKGPSVILVKDRGLYLMSNGTPGDPADPSKAKDEHFSRYVVYAKGYNPETDKDWYDRAHDAVGGDDFGETLPWAESIKNYIDRGAKQIIINFGKSKVSLTAK
jgi:hypothetical protein